MINNLRVINIPEANKGMNGWSLEAEESNADEIRDSVNSTGSLSLRLEQVGAPQVIVERGPILIQACVTVRG